MPIYVSASTGIDFYKDTFNTIFPNLNPTSPTSPLATISRALELLKSGTITPTSADETIILEDGVYRESVIVPQDFMNIPNLNSLKITSINQNAGKCVITGADILTTPALCNADLNNVPISPYFKIKNCTKFKVNPNLTIDYKKIVNSSITEGWDYMGDHTYRIKKWEYIFSEEDLAVIQKARKDHFIEGNKNGFLTSYALKSQIRKNFSERQIWILPRFQNQKNGPVDLRDNSNIPSLHPGQEIHQVFELADLRPGTFFVSYQNDEENSDVLWTTGFPDGVYIKLPNHLQPSIIPAIFEEYAILVSKRPKCLRVEASNVSIEYIGFHLSAAPILTGGVEAIGNKITFLHCVSQWQRGFGFVSHGIENHFISSRASYNSQEGMVFGNNCESSIICSNITNNNSLAYRYLNILPTTHSNNIAYPGYSNGGLIIKGGAGHIVINHTSTDNLGNGIWADFAAKIRIFGGVVEGNMGSGITIERTSDYFEVAHTTVKNNFGPGIRVEGENCYIHHCNISGNKRDGIAVSVDKDLNNNPVPTIAWILHNTLVGNYRGIGIVGDPNLNTHCVGNIVTCCFAEGIYLLVGTYSQMYIYDNLFYWKRST